MNAILHGFLWGLGIMGAERAVRSSLPGRAWNSRPVQGVRQWCQDVATVVREDLDEHRTNKPEAAKVVDIRTGRPLQEGGVGGQ